jgi:histidinol-phosphate aminotransferase
MKNKIKEPVRLHANENFYGCSPTVAQAIKKNIKNVSHYSAIPLRLEEKLAQMFGVQQNNIVVSGGSVRLIDGIIQTFAEHDEEVIFFDRSFVAYEQLAVSHRRKHLLATQTNYTCDVEQIFPLITKKTSVIFIDNPNNPTGTIITHDQLEKLLKNISKKIIVVIDEAYGEYVTDKSFPDSISLQKTFPNLIILRTFSKIYGLAGLRIGYAIAEEKIAGQLKINRIPFFFNTFSEDAALAALADDKFIKQCTKANDAERKYLFTKIKSAGYNVVASQANFVYVYFDTEEEKETVFQQLLDVGLLVCNLKVFGLQKSLRIGVGDRKTNTEIVLCLQNLKKSSKKKMVSSQAVS